MERASNSDGTWEAILYRYQDMVYHLALAHTKTTMDADDVFQEVFLRLVRSDPIFENEEHLKAWLIRTTINCSNSFWSSAWKRRTVSMEGCKEFVDIGD